MSLDGNGTYEPLEPYFPAIPETVIKSNDFNQIILDIAAALSLAIFRDGQAAFTANQSLGGFKITSLANGSAPQDAVTFLQVFVDPTFTGTTADGVRVTGTKLTVTTTTAELPAETSIGDVTAAELAILHGITATTAEINILDGAMLSTVELNILDGATISTAELNFLQGVTSGLQAQLNAKADLDSPLFTGIPRGPTAPAYTASTQLATTEFVMGQTLLAAALPFYLMNNAGII